MIVHWRVIFNHKLWNQEKYEESFKNQPEVRRFAQSKGKCKMINCPKKGDLVSFVYKKKIVMRGIIDSEGFEIGTEHILHSANIGEKRPHTQCNEYIWVKIFEVGLSIDILPSGQRTWAKLKSS